MDPSQPYQIISKTPLELPLYAQLQKQLIFIEIIIKIFPSSSFIILYTISRSTARNSKIISNVFVALSVVFSYY